MYKNTSLKITHCSIDLGAIVLTNPVLMSCGHAHKDPSKWDLVKQAAEAGAGADCVRAEGEGFRIESHRIIPEPQSTRIDG